MEVLNPICEKNIISMRNMVDLALGTPEVGAVNFNILHSLLHAILSKLQMDEFPVEKPADKVEETKPTIAVVPSSTTPYHGLQKRIEALENQISSLNALPTSKEIIKSALSPKNSDPENESQKSASDLWQTINIRKKVTANEEGLDKLSSLVDSILDEMKNLKAENEEMKRQLESLTSLKDAANKIDGLQNDLANLLAQINNLKDRLNQYPPPEALKNIVTWENLEKALKGIKDDMEALRQPTEKIVVNMATEPMTRPASELSNGPSEVCAEMLEKLGQLTVSHDLLDKRVVVLEEEMPNKADKKDLENLKIPDDLLKTISQLKAQMDSLMSSKNRPVAEIVNTDSEALTRIREILNSLQDKMNAVNETVEKLSLDNKNVLSQIEELFGITKDHESRKADLAYVDGILRTKADKSLLDTKVNFTLFDETAGNLHNLIDDVLKKLLSAEEELRNLLKSLASDLNGKVDKDDLNALKEWIEKRIRALADKLKNLRGGDMVEDDAAGLRKQLLQHFHCISCDRPVDILAHGMNYGNGLPESRALPPTKSLRPYTTYELEAIRQHTKNNKNLYVPNHTKRYGADIIDVYQTPRPCGGSHTTTYPQKKVVRLGNINNSYVDEEIQPKMMMREELDIQGADGHIYKGRLDRSQTTMINNNNYIEQYHNDKLPPVTTSQRYQSTISNNVTPRGTFVASRPKSALKMTPRQTINGDQSRPSSARVTLHEPESRSASPVLNVDQSIEIKSVEPEEFMLANTSENEAPNIEVFPNSNNVSIEIHSENEIQLADEALLL